jgi:hypothetical protein
MDLGLDARMHDVTDSIETALTKLRANKARAEASDV